MKLAGSRWRSGRPLLVLDALLVFSTPALWLFPGAAVAEKVAIRPEFQVSTYETYTYYGYSYSKAHNEGIGSVDIAASASGTFVVAWEDLYEYGPGAYGYAIPGAFVRRIDGLGRPLGPEFRVSGLASYAKGGVAVASDPAGRFVVVWDDYDAVPDSNYIGIRGRRYNASGGVLGPPFLVNTVTTSDQMTPKVAMDSAGGFVVVWAEPGYQYGEFIHGRRFDSSGTAQGAQFQVNSEPCYGCAYSAFEGFAVFDDMDVVTNSAGNSMVVWRGRATESAEPDVRARLFDGAGAALGPEFVVGIDTDPYSDYGLRAPAVATDGSGRFVVVWTSFFGGNTFVRRFDSAGGALGGEFQANTATVPFSYGPKVAADASGRFIVTWDTQGTGDEYPIYGREFDSSGTPVAGPFRVDFADPYYGEFLSSRHNIAASGAGQFVVVWGQYRNESYTFGVDGRQIGDKPVACTPAPRTDCRAQTVSNRGAFRFRDSAASTRRLYWRWVKGQEVTQEALGDPRTTNSIAFCVYDASTQTQPLMDLRVPAGGGCTKIPCWLPIGSAGDRFDYFDMARFVGGLELIRLHAKPDGLGRASVLARKDNLELPATPLTAPVTVQVQAANGTCWTAEYGAHIRKNAGGVFVARAGS